MDHFQIRLYSTGVRGGIEDLEKNLTDVWDKLDILKEQTDALVTYWEGSASRRWNRELGDQLNRIEECLKGLGKLTDTVNVMAGRLTETEKKNEGLVDQMH